MPSPIDGQMSIQQQPTMLELLQSAQREQAIAQAKQQDDTSETKLADQTSVTKQEEAEGRTLRDDDPRQGRRRQHSPEDELRPDDQELKPGSVDIVV